MSGRIRFLAVWLLFFSLPTLAFADVSVVVFSKTQTNLPGVTYTAAGTGTIHHTVCDLDVGSGSYDVRLNGALIATVPVSSANIIIFDSTAGGTFAISQHAAGADTTPPTGTISISNNATFARSSTVTLTLSASDTQSGMGAGAQMCFSNNNSTWSAAEPFAASKSWTLSAGDGPKAVYVRYKDAAGNWMNNGVSDSVILDTIMPVASIFSPLSGAKTNQATMTISGTASDANGIASVSVNGVPAQTTNNFINWNASVPLSEGSNQVTVTATDIPGNRNTQAAAITISQDSIPPSQPLPPSIGIGG
jgi:hypothetical protein